MPQQRLDALLVQQGIATGRDQAKAFILTGHVLVDGQRVDKAGTLVSDTAQIVFAGKTIPFVSRGGLKLDKALNEFEINLTGCRVLDLGASTGGFTDCALQRGAAEVIAVDVGYGQLAWSLRNDSRVKVMERINARYLTLEQINGPVDFVTADLAFISLTKVLPSLPPLLKDASAAVVLVKPQFEAGRGQVGKKGVVKDPAVHEAVIIQVAEVAKGLGLQPIHIGYSPITGPQGNIEYLLHLVNRAEAQVDFHECVIRTVAAAHVNLQPLRR